MACGRHPHLLNRAGASDISDRRCLARLDRNIGAPPLMNDSQSESTFELVEELLGIDLMKIIKS